MVSDATYPHSLEAERALLGGVLADPAQLAALAEVVYVLSCAPDWFTVCSPNAEGGKWLAHPPIDGSTEAAALVAALEAAP
jgi:hypothetical protein